MQQELPPLVGPPTRRGWREIVRLRRIAASEHSAIVVTRGGRLVGVLPASGPRFVSDYLSWPCELREVDTRERTLDVFRRLESIEPDYAFDAAIRLIYRAAWPERVAQAPEDPVAAIERAVEQRACQLARAFGVDQARELEENLVKHLDQGEIARRAEELGLALLSHEVTVALDARARAFVDDLRNHMRERPIEFELLVDSLEPGCCFDVQMAGLYRLIDRVSGAVSSEAAEAAIQLAVGRALRRVGLSFAPDNHVAAMEAMVAALGKDELLKAELVAAHAQLLNPTVRVRPGGQTFQVAPEPLAAPPFEPALAMPVDAPRPARPRLVIREVGGPASMMVSPDDRQAGCEPAEARLAMPKDDVPAKGDESNPGASDEPLEDWLARLMQGQQAVAAPAGQKPGEPETPAVVLGEPPAQLAPEGESNDADRLDEPIASFMALLQQQGPAIFSMWSRELRDRPERLPDILADLTIDTWVVNQAAEPHFQDALLQALDAAERTRAASFVPPSSLPLAALEAEPDVPLPAPTAASPEPPPSPQPLAPPEAEDPDIPDWARLRQRLNMGENA